MHRVYIGIDWSENKHDAAFVNSAGAHIASLTFKHTPEGFRQFDAAEVGADGVAGAYPDITHG